MNWQSEVQPWLEIDRYDLVIQFYEERIEKRSEAIEEYWYLGLAYLLAGREEEAQMTWLFALGQGEEAEVETWMTELIEVLEEEANRQSLRENWPIAWLIRSHIREIKPDYLGNLLPLLSLDIKLGNFVAKKILDWSVIEVIEKKSEIEKEIFSELFLPILEQFLDYSSSEILEFLKISLIKFPIIKMEILEKLENTINVVADRDRDFAIEIIKICLEIKPDYLFFWKQLSVYYRDAKEEKLAIQCALKMRDFYDGLSAATKAFIEGHILFTHLWSADWLSIDPIVQQYKTVLWEAIEAGECPRFVRHATLFGNIPLFYLEDNLEETRLIYNRTGELFESWTKENLSKNSSKTPRNQSPVSSGKQKIKVGYIASTLRRHPVGFIARWPIQYHDREQFSIHLYLVNQAEDPFTRAWFHDRVDACQNFLPDAVEIAARIEADNLDILVDLDSVTEHITSQVMALKPAPIQATWLGYDASGLPAIDYFIVDDLVLPENAENYYREKLWRLPGCYLAVDGFEVTVPTLRREDLDLPDDSIVYFTSQAGLKRNPETILLQIQILQAVPRGYLLIKGIGNQDIMRELFITLARSRGIEPERLRFLPIFPTEEIHRANLQIADVVLDTYPYSGATTTLETLWMGIPVVTKVGRQWAARNSYTLMMNAGITEGIAWNDAEYVDWAIRLGTDERLREKVREKLHRSRRTSPLWNTRQFTKNLEAAYRQMWEIYQEGKE